MFVREDDTINVLTYAVYWLVGHFTHYTLLFSLFSWGKNNEFLFYSNSNYSIYSG